MTLGDTHLRKKHVRDARPSLGLQGQVFKDLIVDLLNLLFRKRKGWSVYGCASLLLREKITNFVASSSVEVRLFFTIIGDSGRTSLGINLIIYSFLKTAVSLFIK